MTLHPFLCRLPDDNGVPEGGGQFWSVDAHFPSVGYTTCKDEAEITIMCFTGGFESVLNNRMLLIR